MEVGIIGEAGEGAFETVGGLLKLFAIEGDVSEEAEGFGEFGLEAEGVVGGGKGVGFAAGGFEGGG